MALIRPTDRWHSRAVQVPFVGLVYRPRTSDGSRIHSFEVPDVAVNYLLANNFVRLVATEDSPNPDLVETDSTSTQCPMPELDSISESTDETLQDTLQEEELEPQNLIVQAPQELEQPEPEKLEPEDQSESEDQSEIDSDPGETLFDSDQLEKICNFLNERNKSQLMEIRGIGSAAANAIMKAKPIDSEKVLSVLKENQILAVAEAVNHV